MTKEDRRQIGLTANGRSIIANLVDDLEWFNEAQDAGRFAFGYAVRAGVSAGQTSAPVETRWSADSFDPTGEIRTLLRAMYSETETPIRLLEHLIDEGLRLIALEIAEGNSDPVALISSKA